MSPDQWPLAPGGTIHDAVHVAAARLAAAGIDSARLDAEVLMRHILGLDRTAYFLRRNETVSTRDAANFDVLIQRRLDRESVAYIVGRREFMGRAFAVGPGVLIPRPETEILVEWALDRLAARNRAAHVLDVGTGSGAIAISVASVAPSDSLGSIVACDISNDALRYAAANSASLGVAPRVSFVRGDLGDWHGGGVDVLVANLPYLRPNQIEENPDLGSEPRQALDGGAAGLDLVARLLDDAPRLLAPGGVIGLEIDPSQVDTVLSLGRTALPGMTWSALPDLAGLPRHVIGV